MLWLIIIGSVFALGGLSQIFSNFGNGVTMLAIGSALLLWAFRKKLFPKLFDPQNKQPESGLVVETFALVGVSYYIDNIGKLACSNPAWKYTAAAAISNDLEGKPIYRYNFINKPVKLIPEPTNPHDKNAVAVLFAGELVGYLNKDDNLHVLDILKKRNIKYISGFIGGGDYKIISSDGAISKNNEHFTVRIKIAYV